jgi:hypothetical protein
MHVPKRYFHDRLVLLLLTINSFLAVSGALMLLFRLDNGRSEGYIVQFRSNLGLSAFKSGSSAVFISFIIFSLIVLTYHTVLSIRVYHLRRSFSTVVLSLGTLLLILSIVVSNALLVLR